MTYPAAQPLKITINSVDRTNSISYDSVVIIDSLGKAVDTARFTVKNGGGMSLAQAQVVIISDTDDSPRYFGGVITRMTVTERGPFLDYAIECDDFSWYLEHPSDLYTAMHVGDSDQTIIQAAMAYAPEIDATASVEALEADTIYNNFIRETPRRIIEYMAQLSGGDWYVDWGPGTGGKTADLHYFDAATNDAPYDLSDVVADPPTGPYPCDKFIRVWDAPDANRVIVQGKNLAAVATRTLGAEGDYGRWLTTKLVDDTILTAAQAQARGDQLLANLVEASTYTCEVKKPGLRSGMTIDVTNARHSLSAAAFMITRVETRFVGPTGHAVFSLEMGKLQHSLTDILAVKKNLVEDDQYVPKHAGTFEQIDSDDSVSSVGAMHRLTSYNTVAGHCSLLDMRKSHTSTVGTKAATVDGEWLGIWGLAGVNVKASTFAGGGSIDFKQAGDPGVRWVPTEMNIYVRDIDDVVHDENNANASYNSGNTDLSDGAATFGIDDTDTDLKAAYETAAGNSTHFLIAEDEAGAVIWGYIRDIAKVGNAYTIDIYDDISGSNQNWGGDTGTFDKTDACTWVIQEIWATNLVQLNIHGPNQLMKLVGADFGIRDQRELRFYDDGNYVGFEAPALAADQIWVLPNADGTAGKVLKTDGAGNLGWADVEGLGTSLTAGSVVFSDGTNLAEDNANLFWDDANDRLGVGENTPLGKVHIDQDNAAAAVPVLILDQADVDEAHIKVIGTAAAADLTRSLVKEGDQAGQTLAGWIMEEVEDVGDRITDGKYHYPIYTLNA